MQLILYHTAALCNNYSKLVSSLALQPRQSPQLKNGSKLEMGSCEASSLSQCHKTNVGSGGSIVVQIGSLQCPDVGKLIGKFTVSRPWLCP